MHVEHADDQQELALTYSDSELSRETSPLMFEYPTVLNTSSAGSRTSEPDHLQRPSSDPTPTTMLPPISLASGEVATYDDLSKYMVPFTGDSNSSGGHDVEYFSVMHGSECLPASVYSGEAERNVGVPQTFPPSPWYAVHSS